MEKENKDHKATEQMASDRGSDVKKDTYNRDYDRNRDVNKSSATHDRDDDRGMFGGRKTARDDRHDVEKVREEGKAQAQMEERWDAVKKTATQLRKEPEDGRNTRFGSPSDQRAKGEKEEEERKAWLQDDAVDYRYFRTTTEPELHGYNPDDPKFGLGREDLKLKTNWRGQQFTKEEWDAGKNTVKKMSSDSTFEHPVSYRYVTRAQHEAEAAKLVEEIQVLKQRLWDHRNPSYEEFDEDGDLVVDQTGAPTRKALKTRAEFAKTEAVDAEAKKSARKGTHSDQGREHPQKTAGRDGYTDDKDYDVDDKGRPVDAKGRSYPGDGSVDAQGKASFPHTGTEQGQKSWENRGHEDQNLTKADAKRDEFSNTYDDRNKSRVSTDRDPYKK